MVKRGLITDADRKNFLEEKYAEMLQSDYDKALNKQLEEQYFGGVCPYCHKANSLFVNEGLVEAGKHKVVRAKCSGLEGTNFTGCGHEVYIIVTVKQDGSIFSGYKYVPYIQIIKPEELQRAFQPKQLQKPEEPKPDPPKQQSGQGSKLKPPSPGYHHLYKGYTVVPEWERIPYQKTPSQQIKKFAKQFEEEK